MKKIAILTLVLVFVLALSACANAAKPTQIGTSDFSIVLPEGYASTEDDFDEDQVAYFYKDDNSIDFDVYQWENGDKYVLEAEANDYASDYGTLAEAVTVNYIVERGFWTDVIAEEYTAVDEILNTLKKN